MKKAVLTSIIFLLAFLFFSGQNSLFAQDDDVEILKKEKIGPLRYGMSSNDVMKNLGEPEEKTDSTFQEATGELISTWVYKKLGIKLDLAVEAEGDSSNAKPKKGAGLKVIGITAEYPCNYKTKKGLGIGSSYLSVAKAYEDEPKDFAPRKDVMVIGSITGGLMFYFTDGKVVKIFIGAGVE
jgi:hypothetical protein